MTITLRFNSFLLPKPIAYHANYRPEIDGLRAIAIIPVVLFHSGVTVFSGGYVGVDVFFVISGYLITSIIRSQLGEHKFSIYDFYIARIRRIFPALFVVFLTTIIVGSYILLPQDFKDLGQSLSASSIFSANIFFWLKTGYFDHSAESKPLLHTWSLGVEEQFYIIWPLVLWLIVYRFRSILTLVVGTLFLMSMAASAIAVQWAPSAAFYLIPFRAWELIAGAIIALRVLKSPKNSVAAEVLGLTGLAMIVGSVLLYDRTTPFPGPTAIPPTIGAMLVILSTNDQRTFVGRLLSCRYMIGIGAISYSLYLWHWPILSLLAYWLLRPAESWEIIPLVAGIWVVSAASYHLIEQPIRKARPMNSQLVMAAGVATVMIGITFGIVTHVSRGFPGRLPTDVIAIANAMEDTNPRRLACDRKTPSAIALDDICQFGAGNRLPDWALIGDSFGDAFVPGLDEAGLQAGRRGWSLTWSGCLPLWKVSQTEPACAAFMDAATHFLHRHPEVGQIFLIGRWTSGWTAERFGSFGQGGLFLTDAMSKEASIRENRAVMERSFVSLINAFPHRRFAVVIGVPEQKVFAPRDAAIRRLRSLPRNPGVSRLEFETRQAGIRHLFAGLAHSQQELEVFDLSSRLCNEVSCPLEQDGKFRYVDDNHLSATAVRDLAPELSEFLRRKRP